MCFLFRKSAKPEQIVPDWLIPDNWEDGIISDFHDVSPNTIKGVFSSEYEEAICWVVATLINTGHPWRVKTEIIDSCKSLFFIHVPNKQEKPAFYEALKFYLEQIYVSQS
jgi:hypothetical protein